MTDEIKHTRASGTQSQFLTPAVVRAYEALYSTFPKLTKAEINQIKKDDPLFASWVLSKPRPV